MTDRGVTGGSIRSDNQSAELFGQTPSQTVGPFFHYGLPWKGGADLVGRSDLGARSELFDEAHWVLNLSSPSGTPTGEAIVIEGRVIDGAGEPVPDAMLEIWQANAAGRYCSPDDGRDDVAFDPHFVGFGRSATQADGSYRFRTIMPGRVPGPGNSLQAAHIAVSVFGRGILKRLATRIYFSGADGLAEDPVLGRITEARRHTLMATPDGDGNWLYDIVLQGENETVFFDL